jgi:hypothetical protein
MSNQTSKIETRKCRCGTEFEIELKRGRPQAWCDACREDINAGNRNRLRMQEIRSKPADERPMTPGERVEYLEFLLKSRGTHISQHRIDSW